MFTNWNDWRQNYNRMSYQDHVEFYDDVYKMWPVQQHVHTDAVRDFLIVNEPRRVMEIGGWDGQLAVECLPDFPRLEWFNYEICRFAVFHSKRHSRFANLHPHDWVWNIPLPPVDAFVAAHCIEHMRFKQLRCLLSRLNTMGTVRCCYIEAPLQDSRKQDWTGYGGSHIIEVGWKPVIEEFRRKGFSCFPSSRSKDIRVFTR